MVINRNVGIGTATPGDTLTVSGTINATTRVDTDVINSSSSANLTISSIGGSVIIRLG